MDHSEIAEGDFQIMVKNTFLHASISGFGPADGERRCASVPASLRLSAAPGRQASKCAAGAQVVVETAVRWSDISTAGDSPGGTSCSWSLSGTEEEAEAKPAFCSGRPRAATLATAAQQPPQCQAPPPPPPPQPWRTPLSSRARPWRREDGARAAAGSGGKAGPDSRLNAPAALREASAAAPCVTGARAQPAAAIGAGELLRQLTAVVAAAAAALAGCGIIKLTGSSEGARGWSIIAQIRAEDAPQSERILATAKDALLRAAKESSSVHVLGHRAQPFVSTPVGLAATLGALADESNACWSMIHEGFCRRGSACRWQHPTCQTNVNVILKVERAA